MQTLLELDHRISVLLRICSGSGWDGVNFLHSYSCHAMFSHQCQLCLQHQSFLSSPQGKWAESGQKGGRGCTKDTKWTKGYSLHLSLWSACTSSGKRRRQRVFGYHSIHLLKQLLLLLRSCFPGRKWMGSNEVFPLSPLIAHSAFTFHINLSLSLISIYKSLHLPSFSFLSYRGEEWARGMLSVGLLARINPSQAPM